MTPSLRPPSIPESDAATIPVATDDALALRLYRLPGGPARGPILLWGHANGFAAGSYLPLLQELAADFRVYAFDARGHGGSGVPPEPWAASLHLDRFAGDLGRVMRAVLADAGDAPLYYAAHSFSGVAALRLAALAGEAPWRAMVGFEPPLMPPPEEPSHAMAVKMAGGLIAMTRRRRRRWASPAAFAASLATREPYARFRPDLLVAHTRAILHPTEAGDFELACSPEVEVAVYEAVGNPTTFPALGRVERPVHLVAGDPDTQGAASSWAAAVQEAAARRLPAGRVTRLAHAGHLMPFERPEACRALVLGLRGT